MQIRDIMTRDVDVITCDTTIREAARIMRDRDVGALPVHENDRLVGMITDRDIVVRGLTLEDASLDLPVKRLMSDRILYCFEDQTVEEVLDNMGEMQVRRMPVMSRDKQLVGIISFQNLVRGADPRTMDEALAEITEPGH